MSLLPRLPVWLLPVIIVELALIWCVWRWAGRPIDVPDAPTGQYFSLSYAPYRPGESPLTGRYATAAEIDADLALLAQHDRGIRTYASSEGHVDIDALARKHGLKVWQGIWLSGDRAKNQVEIAAGIALAHAYPDTIDRVVVGNEVLLRRDLPPEELIGDIDEVRAQVSQPVTYADVQDFWEEFPEVAQHVDIVTVHLLPYWENQPTDAKDAVAHVGEVYQRMHVLFPGKKIAIGETGWPSRGRWRDAAAPSISNEALFVREFMALAARENFEYNLIEAFDQDWKAIGEGTVGSRWGIWTAARQLKIPLTGPVSDNPYWRDHALLSGFCTLTLMAIGLAGARISRRASLALSLSATVLGTALGYGVAQTEPDLYTLDLWLAAVVNLPLQGLLAVLIMRRLRGKLAGAALPPARTGNDATNFMRDVVLLRFPAVTADALVDDLVFIFTWTAALLEILLVVDGRYRDFPTPAFAVPVAAVLLRAVFADLPCRGGGQEELWLGAGLAALAAFNIYEETIANRQALIWDACALVLAFTQLLRLLPLSGRRRVA